MNNVLMTGPAYFDGTHIQFDAEIKLKPKTHLLVTILDGDELDNEQMILQAMPRSEAAFARVWDNEEDAIYDQL